jgi:hypothetical protein
MAPLPTIITGQTHSLTPPGMMAMILKMSLGRSLDHCKTRDPSGDDSTVFLGLHVSTLAPFMFNAPSALESMGFSGDIQIEMREY